MAFDKIKISVIVPVYNAGKYLREGLDSIINQTLKEIEIICINDGSTDNTPDILKSYEASDSRIKVINQHNHGAAEARNTGLSAAKGEFVSFLDADDFFDLFFLEKMYTKAIDKSADIVICNFSFFSVKTRKKEQCFFNYAPEKEIFSYRDLPKYIFNSFSNCPWNKLFYKKFLIENGLRFQSLHSSNDLFFTNAALSKAKKITLINDCLITYNTDISTNTRSMKAKFPLDFYQALKNLKTFLIEEQLFQALEQSFVNRAAETSLYNLSSLNKHTAEGIKAYNKIVAFLKKEGLKDLSIEGKSKDYFYRKSTYNRITKLRKRFLLWMEIRQFFKLLFASGSS